MSKTDSFKNTIKAYLDKRAEEDPLFAAVYSKEHKSIDACCTYIKQRARDLQSGGCAIISDDEVFGWAVHYYDEDDIKIGKTPNTKVTVSRSDKNVETKSIKSNSKKGVDSIKQERLFDL